MEIHSTLLNNYSMEVEVIVLPKLEITLGALHLEDSIIQHIMLADNYYDDNREVDMILGVPEITRILREELVS